MRLGPLPPTRIGILRFLEPPRHVDRVSHARLRALVRRVTAAEHPGRDLEGVLEQRHPLLERWEAPAVGLVLVRLPACPEPELRPPAGDHVERGDHLGDQRRVPVARAEDELAEPDAGGLDRERRQADERLERDLVRRDGLGLEMVEQPDGVEAERLGLVGDRDGSRPRTGRLPAVVFADPSLRNDDPDPHRATSLPREGTRQQRLGWAAGCAESYETVAVAIRSATMISLG